MGLVVTANGGGSYTPPPAGTHIARCISIIDIGMQHGEYQGKPTAREQAIIGFELPEEIMEATDDRPERPFTASEFFTKSLSEKAKLRHALESWRGRAFTQDELAGFDLKNILDKPCQLTIIHERKANGDIRAKISGITPLHKSMQCPPRVGDLVFFDIDDPDMDLYNGFSDGIKGLIHKSDNWQALQARNGRGTGAGVGGRQQPPADEPGGYDDIPVDDDLPF